MVPFKSGCSSVCLCAFRGVAQEGCFHVPENSFGNRGESFGGFVQRFAWVR